MSGLFGKVAAVAAAATAVVTLAGAPASAAENAYNTRSVWLDGDPIETDAEACTSRSIYLASGWYTWTQIFGAARTPSRDLYLAAGTYTWTDCIKPHSGSYEQKSSLYQPGYQPAYLNDPKFTATRATYTFGSELDPHF
ncbi:hypothetical protein [Streptomyces solicathayae]|uniref:Secreted protein n=1 Tax=Streptomyces solicathayae TaxID=3081768 RepID=A0ABZ0LZX0_9ACTN|nr:hypothetical protein [Streptomyces sp. HUAS YS2]WOX24976.1 hypothetical protein R2D22_27760 [Streptomyces sp. HUAS YS2]